MVKKLLLFVLVAIFTNGSTLKAKEVSVEQATLIAEKLMPVGKKQLVKKRSPKPGVADMGKIPYYFFTGSDGRGFVIVAADDIARPILGYSADAELTADGELPIPMEQWLESISNEMLEARANGVEQTEEVANQWQSASVGNEVVQLETAQWDQEAPFNNLCPIDEGKRSMTGCVPTAYAILMKYYHYPQTGRGVTSEYVTETKGIIVDACSLEHEYNWDNMPLKFTKGQYNLTHATNVAILMADIGAALQVDYANDGTGGALGHSALFTHFDYHPGIAKMKDDYTANEWTNMLKQELDMEHPIIYRAEEQGEESGHAFIIDGYTSTSYFSVNWGWGGSYNGKFALSAFNSGGEHFNSGHMAYLNTVPMYMSNAQAEAEVNGLNYPTLKVAIEEVPHDNTPVTIYLRADIQADSYGIASNQNVCLELGEHSIDLLYGIENKGKLRVRGTDESVVSSQGNNYWPVFYNYGTLDIEGGTYKNTSVNVLGTEAGSTTRIGNVTCVSTEGVIYTHGKMTIDSGTFTCKGNSQVISNNCTNDTLTINGGTYVNTCKQVSGTDYRRCLWTEQGSNTIIGQASFINHYGSQALCFNGKATINGAEITNLNGTYGCLSGSNAHMVINDCRMKAATPLYANTSGKITCYGGLYSAKVKQGFLGEGCECVANTQAETKATYPYKVYNSLTGISNLSIGGHQQGMKTYNISGSPLPSVQKGINIIRYSDGTTRKVLVK